MRIIAAAVLLALVACSPPSATAPPLSSGAAAAAPREATTAAAPSFTVEASAIYGQWSFDGSCGLYDLIFMADGNVQYYDYADTSHTVTHMGTFTVTPNNRVELATHTVDEHSQPVGAAESYAFDVTQPVTDNLTGDFGPVGSAQRAVTAKRCPEEDRD